MRHSPDNLGSYGLFKNLAGGYVNNLGVANANFTFTSTTSGGSSIYFGILAAKSGSAATVDNVWTSGTISCGVSGTGTICAQVGGLIGSVQSAGSSISNSYSTATITATEKTGGLVGAYSISSTMSSSFYEGTLTCTSAGYCGGIAGRATSTIYTSVYAVATLNSTGGTYSAGGLFGDFTGTVSNSYFSGTITATGYCGGIAALGSPATVTNSYATGNITCASGCIGGIFGFTNGSTISGSHFTGTINWGDCRYKWGACGILFYAKWAIGYF